jgi:aryl-alcohol dehydrogenase-like predicted oxidoreductase
VSVEDIEEAREHFEVATVQNLYNLTNRDHEDVLDYCEREGIGFIPWFPLAAGELAKPGGPVADAAEAHDATPGQVALAWLLQRSPVMLPIPGTGSVEHLEENVGAAGIELSAEEAERIDSAAAAAA